MPDTVATEAATKPKRAKKVVADAAIIPTEFVAYKGFDANLQCRGYQFEVGKAAEPITGKIVQCSRGYHACQNPLDVLDFYPFENGNRFAKVTMRGQIDRSDNKKWAAAELTVDVELTFPAFVTEGIRWVWDACKTPATTAGNVTGGDYAKNASSGHSATNASSGHYATNASSGHNATNASSGDSATNASSGDYAKNASSGDYATNASSGDSAKNASSGHYATNASSGDYANNASSGHYATNASSGRSAKNASSGDYANNASSGHSATNASSGRSATNASSGDYANNASSGDYGYNDASGAHAVICGAGRDTQYKGAAGVWISAAEYVRIDDAWHCIGFATGQAGHNGVPADTWLIAKGGKLVPA